MRIPHRGSTHLLYGTALAILALCGIAATTPRSLPGIVRRHDRDDSRYRELARRFPAVGRIGYLGEATLISDRWVVTAAHVADAMLTQMRRPVVRLGGREYDVESVYLEPRWREVGPHDIALLQLALPVDGVAPIPLYTGQQERGDTAVLVGAGVTGVGSAVPRASDEQMRAATSVVDSVDDWALYLSFDEPPNGTDLEGAPGYGDSGGPAIIEVGGDPFVAGIVAAAFAGQSGPASYGAVDIYTRVSAYLSWMRDALDGAGEPSWNAARDRTPSRTTVASRTSRRR